ncbi:hypothetical protein VNO78_33335 [Psophocarpus tetragonolobus]|uniref:Uncharacterized protein n=1 Tax=Psophocarpus tetragonolobus TaxID=3891 RepID=A0AAN9NX39_PSOTE
MVGVVVTIGKVEGGSSRLANVALRWHQVSLWRRFGIACEEGNITWRRYVVADLQVWHSLKAMIFIFGDVFDFLKICDYGITNGPDTSLCEF